MKKKKAKQRGITTQMVRHRTIQQPIQSSLGIFFVSLFFKSKLLTSEVASSRVAICSFKKIFEVVKLAVLRIYVANEFNND